MTLNLRTRFRKNTQPMTPPSEKSIQVVYARWIVPVASDDYAFKDDDIINDGAIAIEGSRILMVGEAVKIKEQLESVKAQIEEIHLPPHHIIIPGLVNCHTHLAMTFLRGFSDDQDLQTWLTKYVWPAEQEMMCEDYVYYGTLIACYDAIRTGTTMVNDSYFMPNIAIKAVSEAKIRGVHGETLLDFGNNELPNQYKRAQEFIMQIRNETLKKSPSEDSLIRASFVPHSAYTVPTEYLKKGAEFAKEFNKKTPYVPVITHTHLHETEKERIDYEQKHGVSALQAMDSSGIVNERLVAAHCVYMTDEEIDLMVERKANVCHCPKSNAKLGSGVARIHDMIKKGVNVCLGTDGGCSNNSMDMLSEMQCAALLAKSSKKDPTVLDAYTVLKMATRNGSIALGRLNDLGSLELGKFADVVAVDLAGDGNVGLPILNPISHLVYTTHPKVTNVWVNGKQIMKDGHITSITLCPKKYEKLSSKIQLFKEKLQF